jgi:hypothetical protein
MFNQMASFNVDKLTLEYFTNKSTYNKYLAKKDPKSFEKSDYFQRQMRDNHAELLELLSQYINSPDDIPYKKMRDAFNHLMLDCLSVLKNNNETSEEKYENETNVTKDEDQMFSQCDDLGIQPKNPIEYWKMQKVFKEGNPKSSSHPS